MVTRPKWFAALSVAALTATSFSAVAALPADAAMPLEYKVAEHEIWPGPQCDATIQASWGTGCFEDDSDLTWINDLAANGLGVSIHWKVKSRYGVQLRTGICKRSAPAKNGPNYRCDWNFPELNGERVYLRIGQCDGDIHSCRSLSHYRNWSAWVSTRT